MTLELVWPALLGLLLAGYFVLAGFDYGVQLLTPWLGRDDGERRALLNAFGPFFLGNEVWLVAAAGVLFGAFPFLEGRLLSGMYFLFAAILAGIVVGNAAVQLRSRHRGAPARRLWDGLIFLGGLVPAVGWGLVTGRLLAGVPLDARNAFSLGTADLLDPFVLLCGATTTAVFLAHGASFLAWRTGGEPSARAARAGRRALLVAAVAAAAVLVTGFLSSARHALVNPWPALAAGAALVVALLAGAALLRAGRTGRAFAATSCAAALPVAALGAGLHPFVLVSSSAPGTGLRLAEAMAEPGTLRLLAGFAAVMVPLMALSQIWNWWMFRDRASRTPTYL
ncbi:cytochrome d ubiquinol oxidase subunit II [Microbispora siamensis]|uniref:Cytochrome c oxidase assembly protein n=1 Tax=Microbispora siamensis TaxID=564413 RepID=A0ABQ4GZS0_9ACTN|nr:cytochrome d ubiquinol oxidase subunit II [Microbispora siamensis]GIH66794.1 cytochrome c oxidase assembly protein [Microbispora siamensis]